MVSLLLVYGLFNAACVAVLVALAQDPPLVEDDPLPPSVLAFPTNDNVVRELPAVAAELPARPRRPMHAVA